MKNPLKSGFSLLELLVAIAVIAGLSAVGLAGVRKMMERCHCLVEMNASRNLIAGYLNHAAENCGRVLAGYRSDPSVQNLEGKPLHDPINARYPWRLAPNVPKIKGVMLFNGTESVLNQPDRDYMVSVQPNMGINATLVGGHFGSGSPLPPTPRILEVYGDFYLSRTNQAKQPESLVVFASARSKPGAVGYFEVRPPQLTRRVWNTTSHKKAVSAIDHGFVDFRWRGRAVVANLAGNVELLDEEDLRDMRRWSHQAQDLDLADFLIIPKPQ